MIWKNAWGDIFYKESFRKNPIKIRSKIKKFINLGRGHSCPPYNSKTVIDRVIRQGSILQDFLQGIPIKIGCKIIKFFNFFVKTPFGPTPLNGSSWNPQNQYQPLSSSKYQCHKISKDSANWNKSYRAETYLSTDANADANADADDADADSIIP